jgi:hypothetical protein
MKTWSQFINHAFGSKIECSVEKCPEWTRNPWTENPRGRWLVGLKLTDENNHIHFVNLCPAHIREYFPQVNEEFYKTLLNTERTIRKMGLSEKQIGAIPEHVPLDWTKTLPRAASASPSGSTNPDGLAAVKKGEGEPDAL